MAEKLDAMGLPTLTWRRPDKKSKTGLESLRSKFDSEHEQRAAQYKSTPANELRTRIEALRAAKELGYNMPKEVYDPAFLTALIMKEGRYDIGGSDTGYIRKNKQGDYYTEDNPTTRLVDALKDRFGYSAASFAATVYDKGQTAKRLNLSFPRLWNGTGTVRTDSGQLVASGKNYEENFPFFVNAATHPENKQLYDFVDQHLNGKDYTTPLSESKQRDIDYEYSLRQRKAYNDTKAKLEASPLRQAQYTFLGGSDNLLGVPKEYDPQVARSAVAAPNYDELRKQLAPTYKSGGAIENTTHSRKII